MAAWTSDGKKIKALYKNSFLSILGGNLQGGLEMASHDILFSASDSGDLVWSTADRSFEKCRIWSEYNGGLNIRVNNGKYGFGCTCNGEFKVPGAIFAHTSQEVALKSEIPTFSYSGGVLTITL